MNYFVFQASKDKDDEKLDEEQLKKELAKAKQVNNELYRFAVKHILKKQ